LAAFAAVAFVGAALGWTVTPERSDDGSASVDAAALRTDGEPGAAGKEKEKPAADPADAGDSAAAVEAAPTAGSTEAEALASSPAQPAAVPAAASGGGRIPGGLSGITAGSLSHVQAWEAFRGSPVNVVTTFADRTNWETVTHPWLGSGPDKFAGFAGKWVISEPFFPTGAGDLASCAGGAYNDHWAEFGRWLVGQGRGDSIVRLAWEANGDWFPWSVKNDPGAWAPCFRQVVDAIRSTDPQVRIDWTINGGNATAFENYPGDAHVDIVGIDMYDHWPASVDDASWNETCNQNGLCSVINFARSHGKQFSVPEWGLVGKSDTGAGAAGQSGGDNPFFVQKMYDTFRANADALAYETYFNSSDGGNVHSALINPTENPVAAALYASLW
jgi:hypothetical protein